jgi:general stress protein CsbA
MLVLILSIILLIATALLLYSTNNIFNIILGVLSISIIGYMIQYRL